MACSRSRCTSPLIDLFYDIEKDEVTESLHNTYWDLDRFEDTETVDFQLPYGEWIRLFRQNSLVLEDLIELRAPEGGTTTYELIHVRMGAPLARREHLEGTEGSAVGRPNS